MGAITAIKMRAPVLGGNFGVWGGLFSTYDCAVKGVRKKEDPWNAIVCLLRNLEVGSRPLTQSRLPVSSQVAHSPSVAATRRRETVPLLALSFLLSLKVLVLVFRR